MARVSALARLKSTADRFVRPSIRNYNRLEASPRSRDFHKSLRMEVHDPLWFLCRQWQFGEFEGEDAGTAAEAQVLGRHATVGEIEIAGVREPFDVELPLEAQVEREPIAPTLALRVAIGRHFAKLLADRRLKRYLAVFARAVPLASAVPEDDEESRLFAAAIGTRVPDGWQILERVEQGTFAALLAATDGVAAADRPALAEAADDLAYWFHFLYLQPEPGRSAWNPSRLEYAFRLSARREGAGARELHADEYASGHLDWKDFDQTEHPRRTTLENLAAVEETVQTFLPAPLRFSGMPHPRLWQLEDGEVNFGKIDAAPTSVLNVLLAQYGLNYSNDWFVLPYELPINTVCEIAGILVRDVFGQHVYVRPAIEDPESRWQTFAMFHQTERDAGTRGRSLFYLAPAVGQLLESEDIERVNFIRDEMSNMVWAIEQVVQSEAGGGRHLRRDVPSLAAFEPAGDVAKIRYVLGNTVPNNWIPFVPVHTPAPAGGVSREIRLQRARMPRGTGPLGRVLTESQPVYFIEDQEVPRSGAIVYCRFQRTRWLNGRTVLWLGRRKQAGRGEGAANLRFDSVLPIGDLP